MFRYVLSSLRSLSKVLRSKKLANTEALESNHHPLEYTKTQTQECEPEDWYILDPHGIQVCEIYGTKDADNLLKHLNRN